MALMFTRTFALLTLVSYLMVGTVSVRLFSAETAEFTFTIDYLSVFKSGSIEAVKTTEIKAPEQMFAEINFPVKPKVVVGKAVKPARFAAPKTYQVKRLSLPFHEPIVLSRIDVDTQLPSNLVALYRPAPEEIVEMVAKGETPKFDEVSTKMAGPLTDEEPTFLDYSKEEPASTPNEEKVAQAAAPTEIQREAVEEGRGAVDDGRGAVDKSVNNSTEEVAVDDLIAFDYSSVNKAVVDNKVPVVTKMTTQVPVIVTTQAPNQATPVPATPKSETNQSGAEGLMQDESQASKPFGYHAEVNIHATGTNLKKTYDVNGFEVRFQDDLSETVEDFGTGSVTVKENLAEPAMTRSVVILKKGFTPTNTDLIIEQGLSGTSLPMIEEEAFNDLSAPFESRGIVGALLVELDDETEVATIDVPFGKVLKLDGDLKETTKDDYRYQLFIGVKAGNALLTYKTIKGQTVSKVVHVHEQELTFDANIYENVRNEKVTLFEEGLLSREKSPLIIGAGQVRKFASETESRKVSDNVYKVNFDQHLLANRRYLEISHLEEPVFVGVRDVSKLVVPSEHFMRFVLSRIEGAKLGNRCLIQVNLGKKVERVEVGSESVANGLMTYTQMLDNDGKFYDSASDKTRKVIVVGENQGAPEYGQDAKVNLKINYLDGSVQYLNSYCSPNTYLVEQL